MWLREWQAISAQIHAMVEAGGFFLQSRDQEMNAGSSYFVGNARVIVERVKAFERVFKSQLQQEQRACITRFLSSFESELKFPLAGASGVQTVGIYLAGFRAEFDYLSADASEVVRSAVSRAFAHLQRTIIVDDALRALWTRTFSLGETNCESLGACHLLYHGIWAFKTSGRGERTDLVLGTPLDPVSDEVRRASIGLILTEWKVVRNPRELQQKVSQAHEQAKRYCQGILAGFEVASPRYLVIVSEDYLRMPENFCEGEIAYKYVNIAVSPATPSNTKPTTLSAGRSAADETTTGKKVKGGTPSSGMRSFARLRNLKDEYDVR